MRFFLSKSICEDGCPLIWHVEYGKIQKHQERIGDSRFYESPGKTPIPP